MGEGCLSFDAHSVPMLRLHSVCLLVLALTLGASADAQGALDDTTAWEPLGDARQQISAFGFSGDRDAPTVWKGGFEFTADLFVDYVEGDSLLLEGHAVALCDRGACHLFPQPGAWRQEAICLSGGPTLHSIAVRSHKAESLAPHLSWQPSPSAEASQLLSAGL